MGVKAVPGFLCLELAYFIESWPGIQQVISEWGCCVDEWVKRNTDFCFLQFLYLFLFFIFCMCVSVLACLYMYTWKPEVFCQICIQVLILLWWALCWLIHLPSSVSFCIYSINTLSFVQEPGLHVIARFTYSVPPLGLLPIILIISNETYEILSSLWAFPSL